MSYSNNSHATDFEQKHPILSVFAFSNHKVRVILDDHGTPWFVAKEVCKILEIRNSRDACSTLDEDEKDVGKGDTLGGTQEVTLISESGLYTLILRSNKPNAKKFRKWVTSDVLPALRQTGRYKKSLQRQGLCIATFQPDQSQHQGLDRQRLTLQLQI